MRASLLLSVLCFGLPASAFAAETGTYRPGQSYNSVMASSANQCAAQCKGDAQCKGWNFIRPRQMSRTGVCEFNAQKATPVPSPASISGDSETVRGSGNIVSAGTRTVRVGSQPVIAPPAPVMPAAPVMPVMPKLAAVTAPTPKPAMTAPKYANGIPHQNMSRQPIIYGQTDGLPAGLSASSTSAKPASSMAGKPVPMPKPMVTMPTGQGAVNVQGQSARAMASNGMAAPMMGGYRMIPGSGMMVDPINNIVQMAGQQIRMSQQAIDQLLSPQVMSGLVTSLPGMTPQGQTPPMPQYQGQAPMAYGQPGAPMSPYAGQPVRRPMFQHNLNGSAYTPHGNATRSAMAHMHQMRPQAQPQTRAMMPKSMYDPNHMPNMPMTGNPAPRLPLQPGMGPAPMPHTPTPQSLMSPRPTPAQSMAQKPEHAMMPKSMYDPNHMHNMPMTGNPAPRLPQQPGMAPPIPQTMSAPVSGAVSSGSYGAAMPYSSAPHAMTPKRGLYGSLHDDVTVPRALGPQDIPASPDAPIQTVSSVPVMPVTRGAMPQMPISNMQRPPYMPGSGAPISYPPAPRGMAGAPRR